VLIKEPLYLMLQILIGRESGGVLSCLDGLEIFIRKRRKNFNPQVAYLPVRDEAQRFQ